MKVTEQAGRVVVYQRSQGRCELCGREGQGVHHRAKRSAGGTWSPTNLLRACGGGTTGCHGLIEANPTAAMALGLWIARGDEPEDTPVLCRPTMWQLAWWQPMPDGTWQWVREATHDDYVAYTDLLQLEA